ncbi:MAG: hypothetical protein ACTTJZ_02230 [Sphaerochaetaceae bacterium]
MKRPVKRSMGAVWRNGWLAIGWRVAIGLSAGRAAGCGLAAMASGFSGRPRHPGLGRRCWFTVMFDRRE